MQSSSTVQQGHSYPRVPLDTPTLGSFKMWPWAVATFIAAVLLIFILPLLVPLKPIQTVSASYLAGFTNSVAIIAAAGLSVLVLLLTLWSRRRGVRLLQTERFSDEQLSGRFIASVVLASAAVLAISGWLVATSHMRYLGDAGYIIEQATAKRDTGRALYTQLEFAYGPLLLLPEIWLSELFRCSMTSAYYLVLVVESSLGLVMLAYVLDELPIRGRLRRISFVLLAIGAITPHLGLNYTFFRFVSPLAVLLFATRHRPLWLCVLLLSVGEMLELFISPELAIAMAAGVLTFGLLRAWQQGWHWLAVAIVPVAVLGASLLTLGSPYLKMMALFSRGALNLPVGPYPHVLIFLFALVWLVPFGFGRRLNLGDAFSARLFAIYAIALAFLSPALGRCDPLHVMFNGVGVLVLSLITLSTSSSRLQNAWLLCIALLAFWNHYVNDRIFSQRTAEVLRQTVMPHTPVLAKRAIVKIFSLHRRDLAAVLSEEPHPEFYLDAAAFNQLVGTSSVATPFEISPTVENQLKAEHHYVPGYYAFWVDIMNPAAEQRSISYVNASPWLLLPAIWRGENPHTIQQIARFQGYKLPYRDRNPMTYIPGAAFENNLEKHWTAIRHVGPYVLYRQH